MSEAQQNPIIQLVAQLPYKKWWFWVLVLIALRIVFMAYDDSRPVVYDPVALGFANEEAMNQAFAKGYHTRQKMEEMASSGSNGSPAQSGEAQEN
jgi:hypothetical protein